MLVCWARLQETCMLGVPTETALPFYYYCSYTSNGASLQQPWGAVMYVRHTLLLQIRWAHLPQQAEMPRAACRSPSQGPNAYQLRRQPSEKPDGRRAGSVGNLEGEQL
jgi:hypothetical protein